MHRCFFCNNHFFVLHHLRADKKMTTVFVRTIRYVQVVYVAANIIIIIIIIIYLFRKMEKYSWMKQENTEQGEPGSYERLRKPLHAYSLSNLIQWNRRNTHKTLNILEQSFNFDKPITVVMVHCVWFHSLYRGWIRCSAVVQGYDHISHKAYQPQRCRPQQDDIDRKPCRPRGKSISAPDHIGHTISATKHMVSFHYA